MKKILALVLALCMIFALVSCNDTPENPDVTVRATVMKGPTGMGMSKLMKDDANGTSQNDYEFTGIH